MKLPGWKILVLLSLGLGLSACGSYSGAPQSAVSATNSQSAGGSTPTTVNAFFQTKVEPSLNFCRTCHVPGGVADTPGSSTATQGNLFLLSSDPSQDYQNVQAAWENLGKGVVDNKLLTMPSDPSKGHSGGQPWPTDSASYAAMKTLLSCWDDPANCAALLAGSGGNSPTANPWPLLGSMHGGNWWGQFCAGKPDSTPLPPDPRTLVAPGISKGKAVAMNAYWQTCQVNDKPQTCGDLRQRIKRGYALVAGAGQVGAGTLFAGDSSTSNYSITATQYNSLWQYWGLSSRPDNFDQVVAQRWGTPLSPTRNPYPLPGQDPNKTDGGSGQLPMALTQLRNANGSWTGDIGVTCSVCHGGKIGTAADGKGLGSLYGTNSLSDITVMFTDLSRLKPSDSILAIISQNKVRGTGNITNFQLFGLLTITDPNGLADYLTIQTQPSTGTEDPPVWWNLGHRPSKFYDAGQVSDSIRIELSFHFPNAGVPLSTAEDWVLAHEHDADAWLTSLKSPSWPWGYCSNADGSPGPGDDPRCINKPLAQQGAILFHTLNLWAADRHNPIPKPAAGNGSCASCHGAYSPRYVHDSNFLATPKLEGMAAYVVPENIIGTDPARLNGNSQQVATYARKSWFAYSDGPYNAAGIPVCADQNDTALRGDRKLGYLAPPLYGVWATAPYFHNGSVPNVWDVLKPSDRPAIWERLSNTPRPDQAGKVVMGFDTNLDAYDTKKLGWDYTTLQCGVTGATPYVDCNPNNSTPLLQNIFGDVFANGGLAWNLINLPILTNQQIEARKVYNTNLYSQSNVGHDFTSVLTDQERKAIIEYLKTL